MAARVVLERVWKLGQEGGEQRREAKPCMEELVCPSVRRSHRGPHEVGKKGEKKRNKHVHSALLTVFLRSPELPSMARARIR